MWRTVGMMGMAVFVSALGACESGTGRNIGGEPWAGPDDSSSGGGGDDAGSGGPPAGTGDSGGACDGQQCEPGASETRPCVAGPGEQVRTCQDGCGFGPWGACQAAGDCTPGETQTCGMCQAQTCDPGGMWGGCEDVECVFECTKAVRNGSEICDDARFEMTAEPLYLYCEEGEGGVGYIASNTGPVMNDGIARCQGWETNGQNAWDHLNYLQTFDCTERGQFIEVDLPAGQNAWFGAHDQPTGGGRFTQVCIAHLVQ